MSTDDDNSTSANPVLAKLQAALFAVHDQLQAKFNATTDPDLAQAILTEMQEVLHRITILQSQIFTDESRRLSDLVGKVEDANQALEQSIQNIGRISDLVKAVTNFLTLVDKAIDFAKTVAV